ncbi:MAG: carboxypeptidase regulatory-like domain-containing protein [Gemmatimonadaceae bacterium]
MSSEPYASIAAESLAVYGFVAPQGQSLVYYAPDARTLTSNAFARTHCFHPVENTAHPELIGLAFAPAKSGTNGSQKGPLTRDASGVLWLDRASAELRYLEFEYGAGVLTRGSATDATASGRVDYRHLPAGAWIVNHWVIRMPVVMNRTVMAPVAVASIEEGAIRSRTETSNVVTIWQAGGDVISTFPASELTSGSMSSFGLVSGRFIDSTARRSVHHGIPGVRGQIMPVAPVRETIRVAVTDTAGAFILDSVPPGDYLLDASAPSLDALGVEISQRKVHVTAATNQSLLTTVPPESAAIALLCPSGLSSRDAVLHGWVRKLDGSDAASVERVTVSWFEVTDNRQDHFTGGTHSLATITNREGEYIICGLPLGKQVLVAASTGTRKSVPFPLDPSQSRDRLANITVPTDATARAPAQRTTASGRLVTGTVKDTAGQAIRAAAVRLDSLGWRAVSATGAFTFTDVPAGRHVLEARSLGFNPHAWSVTVRPDHSAVAPLPLQHVNMLKGVEIVAHADASLLDPTGFTQRRLRNSGGSYIDQKQIEQRGAQRMTDVLRSLPGVELHPVSNEYGSRDYVLIMRGTATARGESCPIQHYLDGQPFTQSDNIDRLISPHEVSAVEVYPGASQVPPQFKGPTSRCGVIAIWTKSSGA